ncbi:MAG: adenosylcobinamide-GDP ribazoletransferase, partial [Chloroflexota bacterium]|nr:adenosylcobinamide-GDP ribazoletransferase [Chloroflexota bacterium]
MGLVQAFGFLTILPVGGGQQTSMGAARAWFPLVGLALGGALAGLDWLMGTVVPPLAVAAILLAALLVMTRALHVDGFMDACDGLFGGHTQEDRLRIMRDSHVGAFAVAGGLAVLLLKWSLIVSVPLELRWELLLLFPCLSRLGMLATMAAFPYARAEGMGTAFVEGRGWWQILVGLATGLAAAWLLLGSGGLALVGGVVAVALALGWWMSRMLGGMTGDTYGAVNE